MQNVARLARYSVRYCDNPDNRYHSLYQRLVTALTTVSVIILLSFVAFLHAPVTSLLFVAGKSVMIVCAAILTVYLASISVVSIFKWLTADIDD